MFPPPMIKMSLSVSFPFSMASSKEFTTTIPSEFHCGFREITILIRLGSGLPMDSNVLRPMMIGCPVVNCLNRFKSFGKCQINSLLFPMVLSSAFATMVVIISMKLNEKSFRGTRNLFYRIRFFLRQDDKNKSILCFPKLRSKQ